MARASDWRHGAGQQARPAMVLAVLVIALPAMASGGEAPDGGAATARALPSLDARVQAADRQVRKLIAEAPCRSDADCRSAAYGALACGGPQAYLPWSTRYTDAVALERALQRHAAARREQIAARGESSICIFLTDPGAWCKPAAAGEGRCALHDRGRADGQR